MDQMADEMTLRADVKDKRRVNSAEESSSCLRGGKLSWLMVCGKKKKKQSHWVLCFW